MGGDKAISLEEIKNETVDLVRIPPVHFVCVFFFFYPWPRQRDDRGIWVSLFFFCVSESISKYGLRRDLRVLTILVLKI